MVFLIMSVLRSAKFCVVMPAQRQFVPLPKSNINEKKRSLIFLSVFQTEMFHLMNVFPLMELALLHIDVGTTCI